MEIVESIVNITNEGAPLMRPVTEYRERNDGRASAFLIDIESGAFAYRYDVTIKLKTFDKENGREYEKDLARGSDEGHRSRNRMLCYDLLSSAVAKTHPFFTDDYGEVIYDNKSTLYTSSEVCCDIINQEIVFRAGDSSEYVQTYCSKEAEVRVMIKENSKGRTLQLDDFNQYKTKTTIHQEDRSIRTFLEMLIAQYAINLSRYVPIGSGKLFESPLPDKHNAVGHGMYLRKGIAKGVRIVRGEGTNGPTPAVIIDAKVSPFFISQSLISTVEEIMNAPNRKSDIWKHVGSILHDLRVELSFARNRTFTIKGLTERKVRDIRIQYEGQQLCLADYYRQTHDISLDPNLPAIIPNFNFAPDSLDSAFPIEVLVIMPDQRVPLEKMSNQLSQTLLTKNSLVPQSRYEEVMNHCKTLALFSDGGEENPVLKAFGVRIDSDSNKCFIYVRHPPKIHFRDENDVIPNFEHADWKRESKEKKFYSSEKIYDWRVIFHQVHQREVKNFMVEFQSLARKRGMIIDEKSLIYIEISTNNPFTWEERFDAFEKEGVQFVILIDKAEQDTHGLLKYYEASKKILTQHITFERIRDVVTTGQRGKGRQTLENILNKTNMKFSGLNYHSILVNPSTNLPQRFDLSSNDVLVVGYDVAHPPQMSNAHRRMVQASRKDLLSFDPSVVGITANMGRDPHNFVGDYYYQEARREGLDYDQLAERFRWVLETTMQWREMDSPPKYVFIIRNGLSEGQFASSVQRELDALRRGCRSFVSGYKPEFVYVLATKRHFKKFYASADGFGLRNMTPGSVVDNKFVREDCPEFFMQSHYALKGVGKPVAYNILLDQIGVTKDELESFLNSLCYSHQIVNSAVSMPEPVYQADELAKRGRNNYITMKLINEALVPRMPDCHNLVNIAELNAQLTYKEIPYLVTTRFTA